MNDARPICCLLIVLAAGYSSRNAGAVEIPMAWQLDAYHVRVLVALPAAVEWTDTVDAQFPVSLGRRLDTALAALCRFSVAQAPDSVERIVRPGLARIDEGVAPELPEESENQPPPDKTILVRVVAERGRFEVEAREWDTAGATWGPTVRRDVPQRNYLTIAAADAVASAFQPQGRIESAQGDLVQLALRGAELPPGDPQFRPAAVGDVLRPRRRPADDGTPQNTVLDWTWLVVEQVTPKYATCRLYSRERSPLEKLGPTTELLWLRTAAMPRPTELDLAETGDGAAPLAGYEIWVRDASAAKTYWLGLSNADGRVLVPPGSAALRLVEVRSNGQLVARLPVAPGFRERLTARLQVDPSWLAAAAAVETLGGQLLELAARRDVLIARIRGRIGAKAFDEAEQLLAELRSLTTLSQFAERSTNEQKRYFSRDATAQRDIQAMFAALGTAARRHLDPSAVDGLAAELQAARAGTSSPPAAVPAAPPTAPATAAPAADASHR